MAAKAQVLLGQLQQLGFAEWQAAPAVLRHGSNLESAIGFLLEGNCSTEEDARAFIETADCVPDICIDAELDMVAQLSVCQRTPVGGICLSSALYSSQGASDVTCLPYESSVFVIALRQTFGLKMLSISD